MAHPLHSEQSGDGLTRDQTTPGVPRLVNDAPIEVPESTPSAFEALLPGERIGRYIVHRKLGRGGMGVVYGASDPELERRVAIKLVHAPDSEHQQRYSTRLRREAQALARLDHPNIVALYDVGHAAQGTFMAMEYLRGQHLGRWLSEGVRSSSEILHVFMQAGHGLAAAHAAGLVHRDFKPTNVVVCTDGRVKVLDFGLAHGTPTADPWLSSTDGEASLLARRVTRMNVVLGTAGYMAPEALTSDAPVGPRADQFSFCVALYEALHGSRPYKGRDAIEQAAAFARGAFTKAPRPKGVPRHVERALLRGLAIDPNARFADMNALLQALRPHAPRRWRIVAGIAAVVFTACLSAATTAMASRAASSNARMCQLQTVSHETPASPPGLLHR